jgi:hypothetical protein
VSRVKRCPAGHEMRAELRRPVVGAKGATVTLWYCETCDYAEHEVRQA